MKGMVAVASEQILKLVSIRAGLGEIHIIDKESRCYGTVQSYINAWFLLVNTYSHLIFSRVHCILLVRRHRARCLLLLYNSTGSNCMLNVR